MKNIALLGSTGSIGRSTLEVIKSLGQDYCVHSMAAKSQLELLAHQARVHHCSILAVADTAAEDEIRTLLGDNSVDLYCGSDALVALVEDPEVDVVVNALVGAIGLRATMAALAAGKTVALANKESIVIAGSLVMQAVANGDGILVPIDSEHSAILQCLRGEEPKQVGKLLLTASGGPFLRRPVDTFHEISPEEALRHPNWDMGPKITIDSATLMNKGLEVIEAHYLFNLPPEKIEVVVHPQSIIHSMVEFIDGSIKAQLSLPDMRIPIQYALTYPERQQAEFVQTQLPQVGNLTFEKPDFSRFPCLNLAFHVLEQGDDYPTVLNAANEIAVEAFLNKRLKFHQIPQLIEAALQEFTPPKSFDLDSIMETDGWTRDWCMNRLKEYKTN